MLQALKKDVSLNGKANLVLPAFILGGFVFGELLLLIVVRIALKNPEEWFPIGTLIAAMMALFAVILLDGGSFLQDYQLALSMGRARRPLLLAELVKALLHACAAMLLLFLLSRLELLLARTVFAAGETASALLRALEHLCGFPVLLLPILPLVCISLFVAAIRGKYGRRGGTILYFLFLFCCMALPQIIEYSADNASAPLGRLLAWCAAQPPVLWWSLLILLLLGMLFFSIRALLTLRVDIS